MMQGMHNAEAKNINPPLDCGLCPRLVQFRRDNQDKFPDKHNAPVPAFGSLDAQLLIAGLAPGLKGANFTGRPFTGDYAGDLLYQTLLDHGFASGSYEKHADDGLSLINCRITNAVRCVPPENKPTTPEIAQCLPFLKNELAAMPNLKVILSLGLVSHKSVLKTLEQKISAHPFGHGSKHKIGNYILVSSYHCSRYNTQTGRLSAAMFSDIFDQIKTLL